MIKNKSGFTLMELMVVVLIIAILVAIGLPQYFKVVEKQKGTEALGILQAINNAQERFFLINHGYTEDFRNLDLDFTDSISQTLPEDDVFNTRAFTFTLSGINDATGIVIAARRDADYQLERTLETGIACCRGDADLCDLFPVPVCQLAAP